MTRAKGCTFSPGDFGNFALDQHGLAAVARQDVGGVTGIEDGRAAADGVLAAAGIRLHAGGQLAGVVQHDGAASSLLTPPVEQVETVTNARAVLVHATGRGME